MRTLVPRARSRLAVHKFKPSREPHNLSSARAYRKKCPIRLPSVYSNWSTAIGLRDDIRERFRRRIYLPQSRRG
jgi:hypothetical protein